MGDSPGRALFSCYGTRQLVSILIFGNRVHLAFLRLVWFSL